MNNPVFLRKDNKLSHYHPHNFKPIYKEINVYKLCRDRYFFIVRLLNLYQTMKVDYTCYDINSMAETCKNIALKYSEEQKDEKWYGEYTEDEANDLNYARAWYIKKKVDN